MGGDFKEAFFENYFPESIRDRRDTKFSTLVQGSRFVLKYQQRYEELYYFSPEHIRNDRAKAKKFEKGLRPSIGSTIVGLKLQTYAEVMQVAKSIGDQYWDNFTTQQGKANLVADALSRKSQALTLASLSTNECLIKEAKKFNLELLFEGVTLSLSALVVQPSLVNRITAAQITDAELQKLITDIKEWKQKDQDFSLTDEGILKFKGRLCVLDDSDLRDAILKEAHNSSYSIHPGNTKMYKDLKDSYYWMGMKIDVATHVSRFLTCQQVKAERQ
ncbi:uncharacterized protein LOC122063247 [Macadamia integrifolia]|uniref:uncharacterized protein LOC122063247 n=1 Tax=Macadamia integrifolia TaxID=60698 RepID=UPI001C4E6BB5|nr:uncharacterized protein LOC122063247 [Macadamia integrifolia]